MAPLSRCAGGKMRQALASRMLALVVTASALVVSACGPAPEPVCSEAPQRCVRLVTQGLGDGLAHAQDLYVVRIENACERSVDMLVCFEDQRSGADCRQLTGLEPGRTLVQTKEERFFGERIKIFPRFTDEAQGCRLPLSDRVRF